MKMQNTFRIALFFGVLLMGSDLAVARSVCQPMGSGQLKCRIRTLNDCLWVADYPYARNLYCPSSFAAVTEVFDSLMQGLSLKKPIERQFFFYQTLPPRKTSGPDYLDPAQTRLPCLETPAPWPGGPVLGAGKPLCDLMAYVSSIGSKAIPIPSNGNPVPATLRSYPDYFSHLLIPGGDFPLTAFRTRGAYDPLIKALGSEGSTVFRREEKNFSRSSIYRPSPIAEDPHYEGISGGGGAGWGGEIVLTNHGMSRTLLSFGGGGGGGMTSKVHPDPSSSPSALGAGGGGGMQFASGYRSAGKSLNQLGLGAGTGSDEAEVQYSYYAPFTGRVTHDYDPAIVAEYETQLSQLFLQLDRGLRAHGEIVLKGGGGMGAGAEYLKANGEEYAPHALSTQAGFQFRYRIGKDQAYSLSSPGALSPQESVVTGKQRKLYLAMGHIYQFANQRAFADCQNSASNYACSCPISQAIVICLAHRVLGGDVTAIPGWIRQAHCPSSTSPADPLESLMTAVPVVINARMESRHFSIGADECKKSIAAYYNWQRTASSTSD